MDIKRAGGLPTTAVGDGTHVAQITVGPDGAILAVTSVAITGAAASPPTGTTMVWPTATAPAWAVLCDGASYLRAGAMANLFAVIGTTYGAADGTHFNVPDLRDRVPEHASTRALAATSGGTTHNHNLAGGASTATMTVTGTVSAHQHGLSTGVGTAIALISMASGLGIIMKRVTATSYTDTHLYTATGQAVTAESVSRTAGADMQGSTDNTTPTWSQTGATFGGHDDNATGPIDPRLAMTWIIAI